jgi:hypothetical protein
MLTGSGCFDGRPVKPRRYDFPAIVRNFVSSIQTSQALLERTVHFPVLPPQQLPEPQV